jgi:thioredoxin 1
MAVIQLGKDNFDQVALKSALPVLIDFYATWCGPCKMLSPIVEEIAQENEGKVCVCRVDVDHEGALAMDFHVTAVPTLVVMKEGKVTNRTAGYMPKEQVLALL